MVGFKGQTRHHSSLCQTKITDYSGMESGLCNFVLICLFQNLLFFGWGGLLDSNLIQALSVCLALILISVHFACTVVGSTFIILQ